MKAQGTLSLGLSHHGTGCLYTLFASCSRYVLEPFFRSLSSQKSAPCGPPLAKLFQDTIFNSVQDFSRFPFPQDRRDYFHHTLVDLG